MKLKLVRYSASLESTLGVLYTQKLNSDNFLKVLEDLTSYKEIISDPSLDGGGLHEIKNGGYLNIHTDFQNHTNYTNYKRKLNLLLYFNKNLENFKNSELELWDSSCKKMITKIEPKFNRCVIFSTLNPSFHGHPNPLKTKNDISRKSLALYYYIEEPNQEHYERRAVVWHDF